MVEPKKMGKNMMGFNKATFNNSFSTIMMFQEQMERQFQTYLRSEVCVAGAIIPLVAENVRFGMSGEKHV